MKYERRSKLTIYSYQKLWKWDMRIYALSKDLPLPRALPIRLALYLCVGAVFSFLLFKIPFLNSIPFAFKAAVAIGAAKFLESVKLDGKNPIRFFFGCVRFWLFEQGMSMEHFKKYEANQKAFRLNWDAGSKKIREEPVNGKTVKLHWQVGTKGGMTVV